VARLVESSPVNDDLRPDCHFCQFKVLSANSLIRSSCAVTQRRAELPVLPSRAGFVVWKTMPNTACEPRTESLIILPTSRRIFL
jgi:hypothetical protein